MQLFIEKITRKDGMTKDGKAYQKVGIFDGKDWYNGFDNDGWTAGFREKDLVDVTLYESEYQGKMYKNFKKITKTDQLEERLEILEDRVALLEGKQPTSAKVSQPSSEDDDLPF